MVCIDLTCSWSYSLGPAPDVDPPTAEEGKNRRGDARISCGRGTMGGRGALISAIILAMSSLDM